VRSNPSNTVDPAGLTEPVWPTGYGYGQDGGIPGDVMRRFKGNHPGIWPPPVPPIVPWWKPAFPLASGATCAAIVGGAAIGTTAGLGIDYGTKAVTGKTLHDHIAEGWWKWRWGDSVDPGYKPW
jgi:hypothetical protein